MYTVSCCGAHGPKNMIGFFYRRLHVISDLRHSNGEVRSSKSKIKQEIGYQLAMYGDMVTGYPLFKDKMVYSLQSLVM